MNTPEIPKQLLPYLPKRFRASKRYRQQRKELLAMMDEAVTRTDYDYNTSAEAPIEPTKLAFNAITYELGGTGFQAGWAALKVYASILHIEGPFIVLKTEDYLYPQYDLHKRLDEHLDDQHVRDWLHVQATKRLAESEGRGIHPNVEARWRDFAGSCALSTEGCTRGHEEAEAA